MTVTTTGTVSVPAHALEALRRKAAMTAVETWKPTPGETLEGVITGSRKVDGPYGEQAQMLVQTIDGRMLAVWLTSWLLDRLKEQRATRGDLVSLTFHGRHRSKRGVEFNSYSVTVLKPNEI
ncbi:hypothetical protein HW932_20975 [Allochromatium humboldtianum]|uniref:Uncharacterized protein n=2 Tax=Allochromatium humboldtianum TaxID=504901 RepID=A0A850RCE4_9GAMM|nr:hypothetical protein [Allochromatium humboldtianum]